jgi:hypothetical protein
MKRLSPLALSPLALRSLALLALLGLPGLPGCKTQKAPHTIGLALDVGGRGDQSFNDGCRSRWC